jgi:DNA repair exonuclease SbcCD ATPase subunit
MNNMELIRSPEVIANEINAIKSQTSSILSAALSYTKRSCFEIGRRLEEAKALVPHGEWGAWLENNFEYSESTAGNLMRIYREFGGEQINLLTGKSDMETFEGLSQSQLIELFTLPKHSRVEFVEEHREELEDGMSIREMRELIKELKDTIERQEREILDNDESYGELVTKLRTAEKERDTLSTEREDLKADLEKLRSEPKEKETVTETIYEPSKKQIKEIEDKVAAKVEKRMKDDIERLEAQLKEKDELHEKAIKERDEENRKRIRQLELMADPHTASISHYMETISRALNDIDLELSAMDDEEAGSGRRLKMKCESTLLSLLNRYGWQV